MSLHVVLDEKGKRIPDSKAEEYVKDRILLFQIKPPEEDTWIFIANELPILYFRWYVKTGVLKYSEVFFYDRETDPNLSKKISVDINGEISNYPGNFLSKYSDVVLRLI